MWCSFLSSQSLKVTSWLLSFRSWRFSCCVNGIISGSRSGCIAPKRSFTLVTGRPSDAAGAGGGWALTCGWLSSTLITDLSSQSATSPMSLQSLDE